MGTFFVSLVSDLAQTPLRYRSDLKRQLVDYFKLCATSSDRQQWVHWMLQHRDELDRASRDILTRLALSLVVQFGHDSAKKSGRIGHEMAKDGDAEMEDISTAQNEWTKLQSETDNESFESETDDTISWHPQWVELLSE